MKSNANSESRPRASAVRRQGDGVASINMPSMVSLGIIQRPSQWMSPLLALFGHRGMSDLSPLSAQKRTSFIPNCCRHLGVADAGVSSSKVNLHLAKLNFRSMAFIGLTLSSGCEPRRTTLSGAAAEGVTIAARLASVLPVATAGDWKVGCS